MKRVIFSFILALAFFSCEKYDNSAIWEHLEQEKNREQNEALCNRLNENISSIKLLLTAEHENYRVKEVMKIMENGKEVGYMLNLSEGGMAAVYHTLESKGSFPAVSVDKDVHGDFCWTLNGEWMLTDNDDSFPSRIKVISDDSENDLIPSLKYESGYWCLSLDDGENWDFVENAGEEVTRESYFKSIAVNEGGSETVVLTCLDNSRITLALWKDRDPWGGYLDPNVYNEQDIINLTNVLMANMSKCNHATRQIMEIAYNFWKRRDEFIYCSKTAQDRPWDYWAYVGYYDGNTGFTVGEGHGGYKRIDCSTFVHYIINGIDYYSTPYFNALEWTEVTQGGLTSSGAEQSTSDKTLCRTGKMYLRHGKNHIVESSSSSKYRFTKIYGYNSAGKVIQNMTGSSSFTLAEGVSYVRAEMRVSSAEDYAPAVKGESPAGIVRRLRIRENEVLEVNSDCPMSNRLTHQICRWFDENGYGLEAYKDYNPLCWEDSDFEPGTVIFMGKTSSSSYKGITHMALYIGAGYIIHSQAPRGLLGGEGIMIDKLRDMEYRYSKPFCAAASPKYHLEGM